MVLSVAILKHIKTTKGATTRDVAIKFNITETKAKEELLHLLWLDLIIKIDMNGHAFWRRK